MFTRFTKDIIPRDELTLERVVQTLVSQLSTPQSIFGDQSGLLINETIENIKRWLSHIEVPKELADSKVRADFSLNQYYSIIEFTLRRELARILNLYKFASNIDDALSSKVSIASSIENQAKSLIEKTVSEERTKVVFDEQIHIFDFKNTDQVEHGNYFQSLSTGILTLDIVPLLETKPKIDIAFNRNVYDSDPFINLNNNTITTTKIKQVFYDSSIDPLEIVLNINGENIPFSMANITNNLPFTVNSISADLIGNGSYIDISRSILGSAISINGDNFALPTRTAILDNGNYLYNLWFPEEVYAIKVTLSLVSHDLQPVSIVKVLNNYGNIIYNFNAKESILFNRAAQIIGFEKEIAALVKKANEGTVKQINEFRPIRIGELIDIKTYSVTTANSASGNIKTIYSEVGIKSIELWVDTYDPSSVILYFIDSTRYERIPISPVNINPLHPTIVEFKSPYPVSVRIIVDIPTNNLYYPTINSMIAKVKEIKA